MDDADLTGKPCVCCGATGVVWLSAKMRPDKVRKIPVQATDAALVAARNAQPFNPKTMHAHYDICRGAPWWWAPSRRPRADPGANTED